MCMTNEEKQACVDEISEAMFKGSAYYPDVTLEQFNLLFEGYVPANVRSVPFLLLVGFDDTVSLMEQIIHDFREETGSNMTGEQAFELLKQAMNDGKLGTAYLLARSLFDFDFLKESVEDSFDWDEVARLDEAVIRGAGKKITAV